jgi:hypothetical protein
MNYAATLYANYQRAPFLSIGTQKLLYISQLLVRQSKEDRINAWIFPLSGLQKIRPITEVAVGPLCFITTRALAAAEPRWSFCSFDG